MEITSWTYNASIYCDDCKPDNGCSDDRCLDSGCCPQPVFSTSDESDTPQHCEECNVFLENALTGDGMEWLRATLCDDLGNEEVRAEWRSFYGLDNLREWPTLKSQASAECLQEAITQRMRGVYGLYGEKSEHCLGKDRKLIKMARWFSKNKPNSVCAPRIWFHVENDGNLYGSALTIASFAAWIFSQSYEKLSAYVREVLNEEFKIEVV